MSKINVPHIIRQRLEIEFAKAMGNPKDPVKLSLIKTAATLRAAMTVYEQHMTDPQSEGVDMGEYLKVARMFQQTAKQLKLHLEDEPMMNPLTYAAQYKPQSEDGGQTEN